MDAYLKVCKDASENDSVFAVFKSLREYRKILEHTSLKIGQKYFVTILKENESLLTKYPAFWTNDDYGSPVKHTFISGDKAVTCSATTMQYIGVLSNLIKLLGPLTEMKIIEIGGGYGGQCKIMHDYYGQNSYTIVDLFEANALQSKYLAKFGVKICSWSGNWSVKYNSDLTISNYALSEITEPLQTKYVRDILLNSKHGYITCNGPIHAMDELRAKFPSFKILPDIEGEREENFIITW